MSNVALSIVGPEPTLSELALAANREHSHVIAAGVSMVEHAIRAGETLLQARAQCEPNEWDHWLAQHFDGGRAAAKCYMRVAHYQDLLSDELRQGSINGARLYLRGLPAANGSGSPDRKYGSAVREEARRLYAVQVSPREIGRLLSVPYSTVKAWVDPREAARLRDRAHRRREKARRESERKAAKRAVRKAGAALAEAYAMTERLQDVIAQAQDEVAGGEAGEALRRAGTHYRQMRDEIARALGVS